MHSTIPDTRLQGSLPQTFWAIIAALLMIPRANHADGLADLMLPREGSSRAVSSTRKLPSGEPDPNSNWDNFRIEPGTTHVMADLQGPGVIQHIWMTFLGPEPQDWAPDGAANHSEMLLRITWDRRERPDVEAPVGDFFAAGFGQRMEVNSFPVQVEGGAAYNCFWQMPFAKSAKIEIVNQSTKQIALLYYHVDWVKRDSLPKGTPYFCARYHQEFPVKKGQDYTILEAEGKGHYVGAVMSVRTRSPEWFGEGDVKIYVDDPSKPAIWGTGTEDYFLSAWGLRECNFPYYGVPHTDGFGVFGGETTSYRWHIADPIVFQKSLRVTIEHFGWIPVDENPDHKRDSWNEREDDFASVAFWYQTGPSKPFSGVPPGPERKLPEIDLIVRAKELGGTSFHGAGPASIQKGNLWTDWQQILYLPPSPESAWIEIPFEVKKKEPRRLLLKMTKSYDFGNYSVSVDGIDIGRKLNFYSPKTEVKEFHLLDFWPEPGAHVIRLECVGRAEASTGYGLGFDSLRLRERRPRVEQYGFDKDKDLRKERILY